MANDDLLALKPFLVTGGAPVILADRLDWRPRAEIDRERDLHLQRIEAWRSSWAAGSASTPPCKLV